MLTSSSCSADIRKSPSSIQEQHTSAKCNLSLHSCLINMSSRISPLIVIALFLTVFCIGLQSTNDIVTNTIQPGHPLNTSETLVSTNGIFELGFFTPGNSTKYYLGLRFKKVSEQNVVWVANREYPFPNSSPALAPNSDGNLVISDGRMTYLVANTSAGNMPCYWTQVI